MTRSERGVAGANENELDKDDRGGGAPLRRICGPPDELDGVNDGPAPPGGFGGVNMMNVESMLGGCVV